MRLATELLGLLAVVRLLAWAQAAPADPPHRAAYFCAPVHAVNRVLLRLATAMRDDGSPAPVLPPDAYEPWRACTRLAARLLDPLPQEESDASAATHAARDPRFRSLSPPGRPAYGLALTLALASRLAQALPTASAAELPSETDQRAPAVFQRIEQAAGAAHVEAGLLLVTRASLAPSALTPPAATEAAGVPPPGARPPAQPPPCSTPRAAH